MRRNFRSWMMAGALAAAAGPVRADEPVWRNPIAASNALTVPPPAAPREAKSVVAVAPAEKSLALPGAATVTAYAPPKPVVVVPPVPRPVVMAAPPIAARTPVALPPTTAVMAPPPPVVWSAPRGERFVGGLPVSERPMVPCEPVSPPPERPRPPVTTTTAKLTAAAEPAKPLATCRMCEPGDAKPAVVDDTISAVVRRAGTAPVRPTDPVALRRAVAAACHEVSGTVETQDLGDKQVKVAVSVPSAREWALLYARLQGLPELGDYGLVVQVRVGK